MNNIKTNQALINKESEDVLRNVFLSKDKVDFFISLFRVLVGAHSGEFHIPNIISEEKGKKYYNLMRFYNKLFYLTPIVVEELGELLDIPVEPSVLTGIKNLIKSQ